LEVDVHLRFNIFSHPKYFSEARDDVIVPAGKGLALKMDNASLRNLSALSELGGDIHFLMLNDKRMRGSNLSKLANMKGLKILGLEFSNVTDEDLKFVKEIKSLEILCLPENITNMGLAQLKELKSLKALYLSGDGVTDEGLAELVETTQLKDVYVRFGGKANLACLSRIAKLPSLRYHIQLNGAIFKNLALKYFENATSLITLNLPRCRVTETGLSYLSNLTQLESLNLFNTPVNDNGLAHLKSLRSLKKLNIREYAGGKSYITDQGMVHIGKIETLEFLELPTTITDQGLSYLTGLKKLKVLRLWNNRNYTDAALKHISNFHDLEVLHIFPGALFTNEGLKHLTTLKKLNEFRIGRIKGLNDAGLGYIAQLTNLKVLRISGSLSDSESTITEAGLAQLASLKSLEELSIGNVDISVAAQLNKLTNLRKLSLGISKRDSSTLDLSGLKNLEDLSLSTPRDLSVAIQDDDLACLSKITKLRKIHTRYERLISDKGMAYLANLTSLELLWLGGPKMTDKGLSYVANMKNMWNLNISGNFTDKGLQYLEGLKKIERLRVYSATDFSPAAINRLRNKLPRAKIFEVEHQKQIKSRPKVNKSKR
jgi:Leucine-rich repeat (LRR) protein